MERQNFDFSGKTILVSGAANGIGMATARLAARLNARIIAWDRQGAKDIAAELTAGGATAIGIDCDVSDRSAVDREAQRIGSVFAIAACAGICPLDDWMEDDFDETFDRTLAVNVKGSLNLARAFMPGMIQQREGRIVFMGSVSGRTASVSSVHYAASKGGVHSVVRWLAKQGAASNILVNAIAPGPIASAMIAGREKELATRIPLGRTGQPDEIAWPIMFLCSPMASFITGSVMDVNGGIFMG